MRIVHIIFTDNFAGSERHCADLANAQDQNGDEYFVIKNSWGQGNPYGGRQYISKAYFKA